MSKSPSTAPSNKGSSKPANKRGSARLSAVQALYQMDVGGSGLTEVVAEYENFRLGREIDGETYLDADASWFRGIVGGVVKDQKSIDPIIHEALTDDWPLSRIDSTLRAILRAAAFELTKRRDVDARVVVSEYVEVAKAFFESDEPKMVNGVLDKIARGLRDGELDPKPEPELPKKRASTDEVEPETADPDSMEPETAEKPE